MLRHGIPLNRVTFLENSCQSLGNDQINDERPKNVDLSLEFNVPIALSRYTDTNNGLINFASYKRFLCVAKGIVFE